MMIMCDNDNCGDSCGDNYDDNYDDDDVDRFIIL